MTSPALLLILCRFNQQCCHAVPCYVFTLCHAACRAVPCQARVLESVLAAGLGWDFRMTDLLGSDDDSDDEFRPVVVELTAEQLEQLEATGQ